MAEVQRKSGLDGAQAQLWPGKVKYVTSVIFKELSEEWVEWLVRQYGQSPHFALMTYAEYTGKTYKIATWSLRSTCESR